MMITPFAVPQAPPTVSTLEGVPIYLVPTPASTPTLPVLPKFPTDVKQSVVSGTSTPKVDTSKHFHIFVGDLCQEVDNKALRDAFVPFGEVTDAKVIRDMQTGKSKGYGFVSFLKKEEAENAIEQMNGQWLARRAIRTNWATRKPQAPPPPKPLVYDDVFTQSGPQNTTVYVGNTNATMTEQILREAFSKHGTIQEVRIFKQQGYCFIRFDKKEAACDAICKLHGTTLNGVTLKCSWGREDGGRPSTAHSNIAEALATAINYVYPPYNNYWNNYYQMYNPTLLQQWQGVLQNYQQQLSQAQAAQMAATPYFPTS